MTQKSRATWEYSAWLLAVMLGATGMYAANQKQVSDAARDAKLAAAEHALAVKAHEEAVAQHEATRSFINEFDYPIAMLNQRGEVVEWNDAAERDFGWTKEDLQANGIASIMPEEMRQRHHSAFSKAMVGGAGKIVGRVKSPVQRVECVIIHKDPSRQPIPVEVSVRLEREEDGDLYALAHIDKQKNIVKVDASEVKP